MIKIVLLIILSPFAIFCGILSVAIVYVVLNKVVHRYAKAIKTVIDRDDDKC